MSDKEVEDAWRVRGGAGGNTGIKRGGEKGVVILEYAQSSYYS